MVAILCAFVGVVLAALAFAEEIDGGLRRTLFFLAALCTLGAWMAQVLSAPPLRVDCALMGVEIAPGGQYILRGRLADGSTLTIIAAPDEVRWRPAKRPRLRGSYYSLGARIWGVHKSHYTAEVPMQFAPEGAQ